jgi:hypothetical protein
MGTTFPGLRRREQGGPTKSQPTWLEGMGQEAHDRADLEDNYRIKSSKSGK